MSRWLLRNVGTLGLALVLAVVVWVVAVHEEDPVDEKIFPQLLPVEVVTLPAGTILVYNVTWQAEASVRAPRSVWETLTGREIHARADLTGLGPGEHEVRLTGQIDDPLARVISLTPAVVRVTLESQSRRELTGRAFLTGEPAPGYERSEE